MNNPIVFRRTLVAIAVTVVVALFWLQLSVQINAIESKSGTVINAVVDGDRWLQIQSEDKVLVQASSCDLFAFKGETFLQSLPIEPPFYWQCDTYYFGSGKITEGEWSINADTTLFIRFSSENEIQVSYGAVRSVVEVEIFWMSLIMLLLWIACMTLIFMEP